MANPYDIKLIAQEIESYWGQRKLALLKYWDFYYGDNQRNYLSRFEGESDGEYIVRVSNATIENHCAKTCDVLVSYLYGQPGSKGRVAVRITDEEGNIIEELQRIMREVWDFNDMDAFRVDVGLMCSVTGTGIVFKQFVDPETGLPYKPGDTDRQDGIVRYELWDTVDAMPLPYIDEREVIYPRILGAIVKYFNSDNYSGISLFERLSQRMYNQNEILEVYTEKAFSRVSRPLASFDPDRIETANNPYKDINVPFTVFRNYGDPMYLEGLSDISQMLTLQTTLNEILNDDRITIGYHSFPLLMMMGGAKLPDNFIRKANSALELDINQDAKYLTWDNVLESSDTFKESIRKQMTVVSGVSQLSRGNAEDVGQIRSGAGLRTLFQADVNAIALKIPYFRAAEERLVRSTLKMLAFERGITLPKKFRVEVEFPEDFVGIDELLKAQTEEIEIKTGTKTIREIFKKKHPDAVSEDQIDEMLEAAEEQLSSLSEASKPPMAPEAQDPNEKSAEQEGKKKDSNKEE